MLVIALQNHENEIIGVLQLLNAQDFKTGEVIAFSSEYVHLVVSLASQAAVALTNTQLIQNLRELFYAFIKSIATAIDEKSPYTGGHINRVVDLTMMIAKLINETDQKPYSEIIFNEDEMEELRLAAWMHDVGKITTPEIIVDKAFKLQTVFDRIESVEQRFNMIVKSIENKYLQQKIELLSMRNLDKEALDIIEQQMNQEINALADDFEFLRSINLASEFMDDDKVERLKSIAANTYILNDREYPYLTENEVLNLSIRKGTLTDEERRVIERSVGCDWEGRGDVRVRLVNVLVELDLDAVGEDGDHLREVPVEHRILEPCVPEVLRVDRVPSGNAVGHHLPDFPVRKVQDVHGGVVLTGGVVRSVLAVGDVPKRRVDGDLAGVAAALVLRLGFHVEVERRRPDTVCALAIEPPEEVLGVRSVIGIQRVRIGPHDEARGLDIV